MELNFLDHFLGFDNKAGNNIDQYLRNSLEIKGKPFVSSKSNTLLSTEKNMTLYSIEDLDVYHTRRILTRIKNHCVGGVRKFEIENTLSFVGDLGLSQKIIEDVEDLLQDEYRVRSEISPIIKIYSNIERKLNELSLRYL